MDFSKAWFAKVYTDSPKLENSPMITLNVTLINTAIYQHLSLLALGDIHIAPSLSSLSSMISVLNQKVSNIPTISPTHFAIFTPSPLLLLTHFTVTWLWNETTVNITSISPCLGVSPTISPCLGVSPSISPCLGVSPKHYTNFTIPYHQNHKFLPSNSFALTTAQYAPESDNLPLLSTSGKACVQ